MQALLARYGVLAVLVGAAVEGDVTMILAGVMVHLRLLQAPVALVAGVAGAVVSDAVFFALGRRGAKRLRETRAYQRVAPLIERIARRVGSGAIVIARLVYGTRVATIVFWSVHGLGWGRFIVLDAIGCVLWAFVFGGVGYLVSNSATVVIGHVKAVERRLFLGLVVAAAVVVVLREISKRWARARP
jgi:membrane protein DedA with SNARE-associated domain